MVSDSTRTVINNVNLTWSFLSFHFLLLSLNISASNLISCRRERYSSLVMAGGGGGGGERSLEETPTWAIAAVCAVFVIISFIIEHGIQSLGKVCLIF